MNDRPESRAPQPQAEDRLRRRIKLAHLEADLAYFQARLELIGEPETSNQRAQHKAFKLLHKALGDRVVRAKQRMMDNK